MECIKPDLNICELDHSFSTGSTYANKMSKTIFEFTYVNTSSAIKKIK
jgi:hypothetical protein